MHIITGRRFRSGLAMLAVVSLMLASFGYAAWCGDNSSEARVSISVDNASLDRIIMMLTKQAGIDVIVASPEAADKKVSAHIVDQPVEKVLTDILRAAGVNYTKTESGSYLIGAAPPVEKDSPLAATEPAFMPAPIPVLETPPPVRKTRQEKIALRHSNASDIVKILLDGTPFQESLTTPKIKNSSVVDDPNVAKSHTNNGVMISDSPTTYPDQTAYPVAPTQDLASYSAGKFNEANRTSTAFSEAGQTSPYSPYRPGATPGSSSRTARNITRPGGAQPTTPAAASSATGLLPDGIDLVKALDVDNSIIVRGDDDGIAELKDLIHLLDVAPKQVEIKAEFIEVSTNLVNRFGIDWNFDSLNKSFSTAFAPAGNVAVGLAAGNVTANLRMELTSGDGKIVNSPIISTINNMWAQLQIGQQIPLFLSNLVSTGQGNVVSGTTVTFNPVMTGLSVLPRINGDNSVTMYIQPQVMDTGKVYKGPDGTEVPESTTQTLQTNRRVRNGETVVLGGFVRRSDTSNTSEIPILSRLPLIGSLFRSKSHDTADRELLIFLTPRIIEDEGGASIGVQPQL